MTRVTVAAPACSLRLLIRVKPFSQAQKARRGEMHQHQAAGLAHRFVYRYIPHQIYSSSDIVLIQVLPYSRRSDRMDVPVRVHDFVRQQHPLQHRLGLGVVDCRAHRLVRMRNHCCARLPLNVRLRIGTVMANGTTKQTKPQQLGAFRGACAPRLALPSGAAARANSGRLDVARCSNAADAVNITVRHGCMPAAAAARAGAGTA